MSRSPGFVIPSLFPDEKTLKEKLRESNEKAGFTPLGEEFQHSSSDELIHYGVKGMKWGQRRAELNKRNKTYTTADRAKDRRNNASNGAVRRINKRVNKGQDLATARKNEAKYVKRRRQITSAAIFGVRYRKNIAVGAKVLGTLGSLALGVGVQSVAKRAETNRGRAAVSDAMGLPRQASSGPNYAKPNRKNVYNISSI